MLQFDFHICGDFEEYLFVVATLIEMEEEIVMVYLIDLIINISDGKVAVWKLLLSPAVLKLCCRLWVQYILNIILDS